MQTVFILGGSGRVRRLAAGLAFGLAVTASLAPSPASAQEGGVPEPGANQTRKITFAIVDGHELVLDVHLPPEHDEPLPALILVHGGGWRTEGRSQLTRMAQQLRDELGVPVFNVDYRLDVRPSGYPAEVDDVATAVRWVRDNASRYGVDPTRLAIVGSSAGANLGLVAALRGEGPDDTGERVAGVVSLSAPVELASLAPDLPEGQVQGYLGCEPEECPDLYEAASPLSVIDATDPPVFVANSTAERIPAPQALMLGRALVDAGVTTEVEFLDGDAHGHQVLQPLFTEVTTFLRYVLQLPGAPTDLPAPDFDALEARVGDTAAPQSGEADPEQGAPRGSDAEEGALSGSAAPAGESDEGGDAKDNGPSQDFWYGVLVATVCLGALFGIAQLIRSVGRRRRAEAPGSPQDAEPVDVTAG